MHSSSYLPHSPRQEKNPLMPHHHARSESIKSLNSESEDTHLSPPTSRHNFLNVTHSPYSTNSASWTTPLASPTTNSQTANNQIATPSSSSITISEEIDNKAEHEACEKRKNRCMLLSAFVTASGLIGLLLSTIPS